MACPLCAEPEGPKPFAKTSDRSYFRCRMCRLTFLHPEERPSRTEEYNEYLLHNNDSRDEAYRRHLAKLCTPLVAGLPKKSRGLDFGCGPGPTVAIMLGEQGFFVQNYDPFFAPDRALLRARYHFIACTEVAEHFHDPKREFDTLARLLEDGGRLGVMTSLLTDDIDFDKWHYRREKSHVSFYHPDTMSWIAQHYRWGVEIAPPNVVLFSTPIQQAGALP